LNNSGLYTGLIAYADLTIDYADPVYNTQYNMYEFFAVIEDRHSVLLL